MLRSEFTPIYRGSISHFVKSKLVSLHKTCETLHFAFGYVQSDMPDDS